MAFAGVRPVLHVPFGTDPEQRIVDAELAALAESMIGYDVDGLVILGLASEAWALTEAERDHAVDIVATACAGRIPFVVGIDGSTAAAVERGRRARALGAAGLMVLPSPKARGRDAIVSHFTRVADAAEIPVLIQDSPQITGVELDLGTLEALRAAHPLTASLKVEIPGAGVKTSAAHAAGIEIIAGWGGLGYLEQVERGAVGCMPGCDMGPAIATIDRAARTGDIDAARSLYRKILPLLSFETPSLDLLLLGAKHHLVRQAIFSSAALREPARSLDALEMATLDSLLDELAAIDVPGFAMAASPR
jgi:2-keto-3-deoxy-L-arabinonate dehydratase